MKIHHPKTIDEAIDDLQSFLESDMWSKFKDINIKGEIWFRKDKFKKEKDLWDYLDIHFKILKKEIKKLKCKQKKKK